MPSIVDTATQSSGGASSVKNVSRNQLNQLIGKLADNSSSQTDDLVAALNAVAAAINAKPSAS